jgi:hypothetical protein
MRRLTLCIFFASAAVGTLAYAAGDRDGARAHVALMRYELASCGNATHTLMALTGEPRPIDRNAVGELAADMGRQLDALREHQERLPLLAQQDATIVDHLNALRARLDLVNAALHGLVATRGQDDAAVRAANARLDESLKKATDALDLVNGDFGLPKLLRM